jgi:amino-acid N-acetyltransferase
MTTSTTSVSDSASIRVATLDDLPAIERLLRAAELPTDGVADIVKQHAADFVVAEVRDADTDRPSLVGVAGLEVCCDNALLRSVAVRPEWRQHGVGRTLVQRLVCEAESRGIQALFLLTMTAEHYFPRFGFERIERGEVPPEIAATLEFKSACPASAVAMVKPLG